jgi:exodeoxyribonuclease VII large subunit
MTSPVNEPLSVSELSTILKACFENPAFQSISVYGEVYSLKLGKFSYIELGDQGSTQANAPLLKVAFSSFYGDDYGLESLAVGDVISITGNLSYYPHGCSVTLWGKEVHVLQSQMGKNLLLKRQTLAKLDKLGYLNPARKKPIPHFVRRVGILTAKDGAAYQDILKTLHDRFPCSTVLFPCLVQGEDAAASLRNALEKAQQGDFDVLLIGRGGGSKTDLSAFDDEKLALAIATSRIPIITAIGHTIDTAIADRVSDASAITPTEGASLINPSRTDVTETMTTLHDALSEAFSQKLQEASLEIESLRKQLKSLSPVIRLQEKKATLAQFHASLDSLFHLRLSKAKDSLTVQKGNISSFYVALLQNASIRKDALRLALDSLNPRQFSEKGYAIILKNGKKVVRASDLAENDRVTLTYADGRKDAKVL